MFDPNKLRNRVSTQFKSADVSPSAVLPVLLRGYVHRSPESKSA